MENSAGKAPPYRGAAMNEDQRLTPGTFCAELDSITPPGTVLLLGASDSGKSTLAGMLARRLAERYIHFSPGAWL